MTGGGDGRDGRGRGRDRDYDERAPEEEVVRRRGPAPGKIASSSLIGNPNPPGGIGFARSADLHTAAHGAAHVVQQRGRVQLKDAVGEIGDSYEQHADTVADRVVRGESAEALLNQVAGDRQTAAGAATTAPAVQASPDPAVYDHAGKLRQLADPRAVFSSIKIAFVDRWDAPPASSTGYVVELVIHRLRPGAATG